MTRGYLAMFDWNSQVMGKIGVLTLLNVCMSLSVDHFFVFIP